MFVVAIDFIWILEQQYAFLVTNTHFLVISLDWFGQILALAHPLTALSVEYYTSLIHTNNPKYGHTVKYEYYWDQSTTTTLNNFQSKVQHSNPVTS